MGRRGPPPTPTALLKARGSWRASTREGEPEPEGELERPGWLPPEAAEVWDRLAAILDRMGVLSSSDELALARYCVIFAEWRALAVQIAEEGTLVRPLEDAVRDKRGRIRVRPLKRNPRLGVLLELQTELGRLEKEFGLTPAARTLVRTEKGKVPRSKSGMLRLA